MSLGRTLITGGTGSFGQAFARHLLRENLAEQVVIYSRDELKQHDMAKALPDPRLRFFLGDVRDRGRLRRAFRDVEVVVHAAALKQVPACEYNPFEAVQTNIIGAQNVIDAALDTGVSRVLALSSDKACAPLNLYGCTKACAEKLFTAANVYRGKDAGPLFSSVRYGNVAGSRGSVIPVWRQAIERGETVTLTHERMTRFWFTLERAVDFVLWALSCMKGGEVFVPRLPGFFIADLALAMGAEYGVTGIREGEKLYEAMVSEDEAPFFREWLGRYVRCSDARGTALPLGFSYRSDLPAEWLTITQLRDELTRLGI